MTRPTANRSRRTLLRQAGLAGLGLSRTPPMWSWPVGWFQDAEEVIPFADIPDNFNPRRDGKLTRMDLRELKSWITPADEMFTVQHYGVPAVDAAQFTLEITVQPANLDLKKTYWEDNAQFRRTITVS